MISKCELPAAALLRKYDVAGTYTDCFFAEVPRPVSQAQYIEAFYTTWVFKLERWLLARLLWKPSTDAQASALGNGTIDSFAAWSVEGRSDGQLLMCDLHGNTRSWLMSAALPDGQGTCLYFGSAVVPKSDLRSGKSAMGRPFRALLGFHKIYSRVLLAAAVSRLHRRTNRHGSPVDSA